ncbi:MAG: hypothetical protein WKF97_13950 [Chitinophagaceae bacterium]
MMKQLKLEHLRATAPGFFEASGGYTMQVKPYTDKTSNGLAKAIIDFINFNGGDANRINTTGTMRKIKGEMKWTHGGTRRGTADVHAIVNGRHVSIEIKIGNDKASEHQLKEKARVERAGGLYLIARDMPSFLTWYDSIFVNAATTK